MQKILSYMGKQIQSLIIGSTGYVHSTMSYLHALYNMYRIAIEVDKQPMRVKSLKEREMSPSSTT
jgi:hypothetical protein